jgi:hypothetical protein
MTSQFQSQLEKEVSIALTSSAFIEAISKTEAHNNIAQAFVDAGFAPSHYEGQQGVFFSQQLPAIEATAFGFAGDVKIEFCPNGVLQYIETENPVKFEALNVVYDGLFWYTLARRMKVNINDGHLLALRKDTIKTLGALGLKGLM